MLRQVGANRGMLDKPKDADCKNKEHCSTRESIWVPAYLQAKLRRGREKVAGTGSTL